MDGQITLITEATATVIVAMLTLATVVYSTNQQRKIQKQADDINDAVNGRHSKKDADGNMPGKLYDLVIENHVNIHVIKKWMEGYDGSSLPDAEAVNDFCERIKKLEEQNKP